MPSTWRLPCGLALLVAVGTQVGCMTREAGMVMRHKLAALQAEQVALKEQLADVEAREAQHAAASAKGFDQLSQALQGMGSSARLADADLGTQLERMGQDLQDLRGAIEVNEHRIGESENKLQQSLGERLDQLAKQVAQAGERQSRGDGDGARLPAGRGRALAAAIAKLKAGQGAAGRAMLRAVLKSWPNTMGTSDEAFYRLGDSLAGELGCESALREFIAVIERFPKSPWVDDAYYRIGVCSQALGRLPDAEAFFGELLARYPKSPWRDDAQRRLQAVRGAARRPARPAKAAAEPAPPGPGGAGGAGEPADDGTGQGAAPGSDQGANKTAQPTPPAAAAARARAATAPSPDRDVDGAAPAESP